MTSLRLWLLIGVFSVYLHMTAFAGIAPSYIISTPNVVRAGEVFKVSVTMLWLDSGPVEVRASILEDSNDVINASMLFDQTGNRILEMTEPIPYRYKPGNYTFEVEGKVTSSGERAFYNVTDLTYKQKALSVFVELSRHVYKQGQTVQFRLICVTTEMRPRDVGLTVFAKDPTGTPVRRWLYVVTNSSGVATRSFRLADQPNFGSWTIEVADSYVGTYTKSFLVEEYAQSKFDVTVLTSPYIEDSNRTITGLVSALLQNGRAVTGTAHVTLTLKASFRTPDSRETTGTNEFPQLQADYSEFTGDLSFEFNRTAVLNSVNQFYSGTNSLAGFTCRFDASVTEQGSNLTKTGYSTTDLLDPRVKLAWVGDRVRTFKPDSTFTVYLTITHFDGSPVQEHENRTVHLGKIFQFSATPTGDAVPRPEQQLVKLGIVKFDIPVESAVQTMDLRARLDQDISTEIRLKAHRSYSPGDNYITVTSTTEESRVNETMEFHVKTSHQVPQIFYEIVSKGKIVATEAVAMSSDQQTFSVIMTTKMSPTAHIVVYYIATSTDEMVADSMSFFVNDSRTSNLKINVEQGKNTDMVELKVKAPVGSYIATTAIPEDVFNKNLAHELTEIQVLDEMSSYDNKLSRVPRRIWNLGAHHSEYQYFPSSGSSLDASSTFTRGGLTMLTDADIPSIPNFCSEPLHPCFNGYSCYRDDEKCDGKSDCEDWADEQGCDWGDSGIPNVTQQFSKHFRFYADGCWAWKEGFVGSEGQISFQVPPPKSSMTWIITALSISPTEGLVLEHTPFKYDATPPMHIDVEAPDVVTRGEQIGVKVTVFNNFYTEEDMEITVTIRGGRDLYAFVLAEQNETTSSYSQNKTKEDHSVAASLKAGQSVEIYLPIVPKMVKGEFNFTVDATSSVANDTVKKAIRVEADGIPNYYHTPYFIDMSNPVSVHPGLTIQVPSQFTVPEVREHLYVPGSAEADISVYGGVVSPRFSQYKTAEDIFRKPCSGATTSLFNIAYNMMNIRYLDILNQLDTRTQETILDHVNLDLQNALSYMNPDGSFRMFKEYGHNSSSIWFTAFALKTFHESRYGKWEQHVFIPFDVTNKMIKYLCAEQNESGAWLPDNITYNKQFMTASKTTTDNFYSHPIPLTAYVYITLTHMEGQAHEEAYVCLRNARVLAKNYLSTHVSNIVDADVFHLAITAYAFSLSKDKTTFDKLWNLRKQVDSGIYFSNTDIPENPDDIVNTLKFLLPRIELKNDAYAVQSTAYALLAHLEIFRPDSFGTPKVERDAIVRWLNNKRNHIGGFVSTQDTLTAVKALLEYSLPDPTRLAFDLSIDLWTSESPNWHGQVDMSGTNYTKLVEYFPEKVYGIIWMNTTGSGKAMLQISTTVNVEYQWLLKSAQQHIAWFYALEAENISFKGNIFEMTVCARWMNTDYRQNAGLTVMEIQIPTGYIVKNETLREYVRSGMVPSLKQALFYDRKLVYVFSQIDSRRTCVTFEAHRWYPVANMTIQHRMSIFDQSEPGMQNTTMYTTYNLFALSICDVCASYQCPKCPTINDSKQGHGQIGTTISASTLEPTTKLTGNAISGSRRLTSYVNYQLLATLLSFVFIQC